MNRVQMLKLAYARGAFLALQEAGYHEKVAEDLAMKIADRDALDVLGDVGIGAGIGSLGGAALGAGGGALASRFGRTRMNPNIAGDMMSEPADLLRRFGPKGLEEYAASGVERTIPWAKPAGGNFNPMTGARMDMPSAAPPVTLDQNMLQQQLSKLYGHRYAGNMAAGGAAGAGLGALGGGIGYGIAGE